jgi:hypothetical protein
VTKLEILHVPDCPNVELLRQRLAEALGESDADLTVRVITDAEEAVAAGMTGSPTLLVDSIDPFAEPGREPSMSCRLYRDAEGRASGAPSVAALRQVVRGQRATASAVDCGEPCCGTVEDSQGSSSTLRAWRARSTPADAAERAMHQAILRAFAATGAAPGPLALQRAAAPFAVPAEEVLARLHQRDVIRLDVTGDIRAAYPFSAVPTRHQVRLGGGQNVHAMCVIDALGMAAMLAADAVITTTPPDAAQPITVTVTDGRAAWNPASAVVFVGAQAGAGPSADVCCDYLNAFADRAAAQAWSDAHPDILGTIIVSADAVRLGTRIFGNLLRGEREPTPARLLSGDTGIGSPHGRDTAGR